MKGKASWNNGLKIGAQSEEVKLKRSKALMGKKTSPETKSKIKERVSKPVIQYDFLGNRIKEWISLKEVSKHLPCSHGKISEYINGKSNIKTFKGFIWKLKK